jgi:hypothetical protein
MLPLYFKPNNNQTSLFSARSGIRNRPTCGVERKKFRTSVIPTPAAFVLIFQQKHVNMSVIGTQLYYIAQSGSQVPLEIHDLV